MVSSYNKSSIKFKDEETAKYYIDHPQNLINLFIQLKEKEVMFFPKIIKSYQEIPDKNNIEESFYPSLKKIENEEKRELTLNEKMSLYQKLNLSRIPYVKKTKSKYELNIFNKMLIENIINEFVICGKNALNRKQNILLCEDILDDNRLFHVPHFNYEKAEKYRLCNKKYSENDYNMQKDLMEYKKMFDEAIPEFKNFNVILSYEP